MSAKKWILVTLCVLVTVVGCAEINSSIEQREIRNHRIIEDFNYNWKFYLGDTSGAFDPAFDDSGWRKLNVPHDWSIEEGYQQGQTSAATGFVPGGIGWYRKSFAVSPLDKNKHIYIIFDGVYNNSTVWINGHLLGTRPYGYATFKYDLSKHLKYDGSDNVIAVKVNRQTYADSRWYTGSGIYRKVQLVKALPLHIAYRGVQITTPEVKSSKAKVHVDVQLKNIFPCAGFGKARLICTILDSTDDEVAQKKVTLKEKDELAKQITMTVKKPQLWSTDQPNLYRLKVDFLLDGKLADSVTETFGIRTFKFDANTGFSLNGKPMKIKGVNLHHDAGAVGAAVPKALWEYRVGKLKSIGVNTIRMAHNPHSVELMDVCDEMGMLAIAEAFDEWHVPKGKNLEYIGDNKATGTPAARSYSEHFNEWAERDLKSLIKRDFNHPSVIMWSIGNEIEWTFPFYSEVFNAFEHPEEYLHGYIEYDTAKIKKELDKHTGGKDPLVEVAKKLSSWVKEVDTSRPVTCGSVRPSITLASGYADCVDVLGFNYRAADYDAAHKHYPDLKILGTENWGTWSEWKECISRDFVAGICAWTGFAYLGEAGPWPRKGLEISFFDFAGFKTARGHFYECLWIDEPKIHMVTTPAKESEYSFDKNDGWKFTMQLSPPPVWDKLRLWEWYKVYPQWKYEANEPVIIQTYTNCQEAELFLNGQSLGKQKRADFTDDNIIKWMVPYKAGKLKAVGCNNGVKAAEYTLKTHGELSKIQLQSTKTQLSADGYDVAVITVELLDGDGHLISDADEEIKFEISDMLKNLGVDNGWEYNVQPHKTDTIRAHQGKAALIVQSTKTKGVATIRVVCGDIQSKVLRIKIK